MPPRFLPSPFVLRAQRLFHDSARLRDLPNHYETLRVATDATPVEVKKSFYALSKAHHPDLHPEDPNAAKRFHRISEAYQILGIPAERRKYDQEFLSRARSPIPSQTPRGSHWSSGPAGGRPASGLSRRQTQFRGPPPSFYRSGGWGEQTSKRQAASENYQTYNGSEMPNAAGSGSMGSGQRPGYDRDVPHFDWREHLRTHENHSKRQNARRRKRGDPAAGSGLEDYASRSAIGNLVVVGGVLVIGLWLPWVIIDGMVGTSKKKKDYRG